MSTKLAKKNTVVFGGVMLLAFCALFFISTQVFASSNNNEDIYIFLEEEQLTFDVAPVIEEGRTLVPFRKLAESIDVNVSWVAGEEKIVAESKRLELIMTVGSNTAYLNEKSIEMDVSPRIIEGRTLIPLRHFSETFDVNVNYEDGKVHMKLLEGLTLDGITLSGFYALGYEGRSSWEELFGDSYPDVDEDNWTELFDDIHLGWFEVSDEGELISSGERYGFRRPQGYEDVIKELKARDIDRNMTIFARQDGSEESSSITTILNSESKSEKLIGDIIEELMAGEYSGVNLDFEELGRVGEENDEIERIRENYLKFIHELDSEMEENHKLVLTVHPPNSAYKGYDYEGLNNFVDKFVIMSYDYHDRNTPSATAPIDKVEEGIVQLKEKVPGEKIVLGIRFPAVKYEKSSEEASNQEQTGEDNLYLDNDPLEEEMTENWIISHPYLDSVYKLKENQALTKKWDNSSAVNYLEFEDDQGNQNYIYMESIRSLMYKWHLVDKYHLKGISFWRLGAVPDFVYEELMTE